MSSSDEWQEMIKRKKRTKRKTRTKRTTTKVEKMRPGAFDPEEREQYDFRKTIDIKTPPEILLERERKKFHPYYNPYAADIISGVKTKRRGKTEEVAPLKVEKEDEEEEEEGYDMFDVEESDPEEFQVEMSPEEIEKKRKKRRHKEQARKPPKIKKYIEIGLKAVADKKGKLSMVPYRETVTALASRRPGDIKWEQYENVKRERSTESRGKTMKRAKLIYKGKERRMEETGMSGTTSRRMGKISERKYFMPTTKYPEMSEIEITEQIREIVREFLRPEDEEKSLSGDSGIKPYGRANTRLDYIKKEAERQLGVEMEISNKLVVGTSSDIVIFGIDYVIDGNKLMPVVPEKMMNFYIRKAQRYNPANEYIRNLLNHGRDEKSILTYLQANASSATDMAIIKELLKRREMKDVVADIEPPIDEVIEKNPAEIFIENMVRLYGKDVLTLNGLIGFSERLDIGEPYSEIASVVSVMVENRKVLNDIMDDYSKRMLNDAEKEKDLFVRTEKIQRFKKYLLGLEDGEDILDIYERGIKITDSAQRIIHGILVENPELLRGIEGRVSDETKAIMRYIKRYYNFANARSLYRSLGTTFKNNFMGYINAESYHRAVKKLKRARPEQKGKLLKMARGALRDPNPIERVLYDALKKHKNDNLFGGRDLLRYVQKTIESSRFPGGFIQEISQMRFYDKPRPAKRENIIDIIKPIVMRMIEEEGVVPGYGYIKSVDQLAKVMIMKHLKGREKILYPKPISRNASTGSIDELFKNMDIADEDYAEKYEEIIYAYYSDSLEDYLYWAALFILAMSERYGSTFAEYIKYYPDETLGGLTELNDHNDVMRYFFDNTEGVEKEINYTIKEIYSSIVSILYGLRKK